MIFETYNKLMEANDPFNEELLWELFCENALYIDFERVLDYNVIDNREFGHTKSKHTDDDQERTIVEIHYVMIFKYKEQSYRVIVSIEQKHGNFRFSRIDNVSPKDYNVSTWEEYKILQR
jgi:hypothetical protein